jgi:hypothetical protein
MADKVEYSRLRIKRTDFTGVSPTTPSGDTLNTFIDTDTFVGEFFLNTTDDRLWIRTDNSQIEVSLLKNLPTSSSGLTTNQLFTQTATQLGGTGTTKVICIV